MAETKQYRNFSAGVVTSMRADEIPDAASPRAWNNALLHVGGDHAIPAKRRGALVLNQTAVTGSPAIIGQYAFKRRTGSNYAAYHILVSDTGRLDILDAGTVTNIGTPFTSGDYPPTFITATNACFIVNGVDAKKFNGTTVQNFGITRPSAAPTAVDSGVAGNPNGTYEFAISYGNSSTGHESSRSDTVSVTVASKYITVGWATPTDPQVDQVFLHVRKPSITSQFFRLMVGTTPSVSSAGAFGITADPITVDVTDAQLNTLLLLSPDIAENNPPPSGLKALAWHQSRMFGIDATKLYYSKIGLPEAFDPDYYELVGPDDGQMLTGLAVAFGELVVFKRNALYILDGSDPQSWSIQPVDMTIGCTSQQSIRYVNGFLYWWSERGPVRWNGSGTPELIGEALIAATVSGETLAYGRFGAVCTEVDTLRTKVLFAVSELGQTRNTLILPFNYKVGGWDSDRWDPFDVASMTVVDDANGTPWVTMGNYGGRVFQWWNADTDGAQTVNAAGTLVTLSGTATASTADTLTDSTATFDTDGAGLAELYVYVTDATGSRERRRIVSNTGTVLTVATDFSIVPATYVLATADWQYDTKWIDFGEPFHRKHWLFLQCQAASYSGSATIDIDVLCDWDETDVCGTYSFTGSGGGALWDSSSALWDAALFGSAVGAANARRRIGSVSTVVRFRARHQTPNLQVALTKFALTAVTQTEKRK